MIKIVSSFGPEGWDKYAKKFVETFIEHWPAEVELHLYHHDTEFEQIAAPNVVYHDLVKEDPEIVDFRKKCDNPAAKGIGPDGQYNFRFDALKFSNKVFAISHATVQLVFSKYDGWLIWLDADTFTTQKVDLEWLNSMLPQDRDIVHLPRTALPYSETSWVGFNFTRNEAKIFVADLRNLYAEGEIFQYREWHDGFIFSRLIHLHEQNGLKTHSLTPKGYPGIDAFEVSPLGQKMTHLKGNRKNTVATGGMQPLRITPVDSMPAEHIQKSARTSERLFKRWLKKCKTHNREMIICSAGETLLKHLKDIKKRQEKGAYVMAVKHSLPMLHKNGIIPDGCIILDPRDVTQKSTHGVVRTTLFDDVHPKTTFFVATMTDTSVLKHIFSKTKRVVGWVAWTQALKEVKQKEGRLVLLGGTCAAWRALHLAETLGFKKLRLYGFDFVVDEAKVDMKELDTKGRPKYLKIFIGTSKRKEITTGELCAGIQDVTEMMARSKGGGMDVTMIGDRGAAFLWNELSGPKEIKKEVPLVDFEKEYR